MSAPGHLDIVYGRRVLELRLLSDEVLRAEARVAAAQGSDLRGHLLRAGRLTMAQDAQVRASFQGWTAPGMNSTQGSSAGPSLSGSSPDARRPSGIGVGHGGQSMVQSLASSSQGVPGSAADPRTAAKPSDPPRGAGPSSLLKQNSLPKPGGVFAGHTIEKELARGGMGAVFIAKDPTGRPVALKVMLAGWKSGSAAERFKREAELGLRLEHPNVVRVLGSGEAEQQAWLTMELLVGAKPLDEWCEAKQVPPRGRVELVMQLCAGIQHAHEQGAIHRDLKPANVLVVPGAGEGAPGQVRVVDFGLARLVDEERLTQSGATMGTLEYMAPEQVQGRTAHADARTDVWAIGAIVYELFTGKTPFHGDTSIEVMRSILSLPVPPMGPTAAEIPGLVDVVRVALEKEPDKRYPSAVALGRDLAAVLSGTGSSDAARRARQDRGRRVRRGLGTIVVGGLALGGAGLAGRAVLASRARAERTARSGRVDAMIVEALDVRGTLEVEGPLVLRLREQLLDGADSAELEATTRRVETLAGLVALASGDVPAASAALALVGPAAGSSPPPELVALRAGLAAHDEAADAKVAVADLDAAIKAGLSRPEARGWRGLAAARLAESSLDAARALADLDALGAARPLRGVERAARVRLLVRAGRLDDAAEYAAGAPPPELRWPLGLHLATTRLSAGDLPGACVAAEALGDGPPPEASKADAAALARRLLQHVDPLSRELQPAKNPDPVIWKPIVRALAVVRRLDPARKLEPTFPHLLQVATGVVSRGDVDLAEALAPLAQDDFAAQSAIGLFGERQRSNWQKRRFMPILRRALELAEEPDDKHDLEARLVTGLADVAELALGADAKKDEPFRLECVKCAEECVLRAERVLPLVVDVDLRVAVLTSHGQALRVLGRLDASLRALDEALETKQDVSASFERTRTLAAMHRDEDVLEEAKHMIRMSADSACVEHDAMVLYVWRLGRARPAEREHVRHAVDRIVLGRPEYGDWWTRSALLRLEDGDAAGAKTDLARAIDHAGERVSLDLVRAAAKKLDGGDVDGTLADVRSIVAGLDK